jgi:hypothetical protein
MDQVDFEVGTPNITNTTTTSTTTTDRNADNFLKQQSHGMATMNDSATQWTFTEELQLLQARAAGKTWNQIQVYHFPSKTTAICQAYYEAVMTRAGRRNGTSAVGKPTEESSEASWVPIQAEIGEAWEVVEEMVRSEPLRALTFTC